MADKDRLFLDVDAMREALLNLPPETKEELKELLFEVLTTERWNEIREAVNKYGQGHDRPFAIREAVPDITEDEDELFQYLTQFFRPTQ